MLRGCTSQPQFDTPRFSWGPLATVDFAWDAVAPGAEYRYTLAARTCGQAGAGRDVVSAETDITAIALALPPSVDGEYYVFRVEAWKNDRLIGDLYTHDSGAHSWNYRFRVRNTSLPRWSYLSAGAGLVLLLAGAGTHYHRHVRQRRAELARARAETARQARHGSYRDGAGAGGKEAEFR